MGCLTSGSSHAKRDGEKRSLTEPAVGDFAARLKNLFREMAMSAARIFYMELAARCRSLAAVR